MFLVGPRTQAGCRIQPRPESSCLIRWARLLQVTAVPTTPPASLTLRLSVKNHLFGLAYAPSREASKNLQFLRRAYWQVETWRRAEGPGDLAWVAFAWGFV